MAKKGIPKKNSSGKGPGIIKVEVNVRLQEKLVEAENNG